MGTMLSPMSHHQSPAFYPTFSKEQPGTAFMRVESHDLSHS